MFLMSRDILLRQWIGYLDGDGMDSKHFHLWMLEEGGRGKVTCGYDSRV
jgi:hypothetical protein